MTHTKDLSTIARNIRKRRELLGLTREQFCEALHYDVNYWGSIERGERAINLQKLIEVSDFFGVPLNEFVGAEQPEHAAAEQLEALVNKLQTCTSTQLATIHKFVDEIVPYIK